MQKAEDILTGIMLIGSTVIAAGIVFVGAFLFLGRSNFMPLTVLFAIVFLALYVIRNIKIGLHIIIHGRYWDETTVREHRRYMN